jgi:hypothetical protein
MVTPHVFSKIKAHNHIKACFQTLSLREAASRRDDLSAEALAKAEAIQLV